MAKNGKINCVSLVATLLGDKGSHFGNGMHEESKQFTVTFATDYS